VKVKGKMAAQMQILKAKGWISLRQGPVDCYQCPGCGELSEKDFVWYSGDGLTCMYCNTRSEQDLFTPAQKEVTFAICADCGTEIALTPANEGSVGYLCACDNYVAIPFGEGLVSPQEITELQWNEDIHARSIRLNVTCSATKCETDKDWQVIIIMQVTCPPKTRPE
jgi:hypothetical protein